MERSTRNDLISPVIYSSRVLFGPISKRLTSKQCIFTGAASLLLLSTFARADVVLRPEPPALPSSQTKGGYAESRFGAAPAPLNLDGKSHSSDASDGDSEEKRTHFNRSPAGLSFSGESGSAKAHPVIEEQDMPRSLTNLNPLPQLATTRTGVQEISVIAGDQGFFPKTIFVTRDIPVKLFVTSASKKTLCIMMDLFHVRRQVRSQKIEEVSFLPTSPGKFRFYCPVNGTEGTLLVKDYGSNSVDMGSEGGAQRSISSVPVDPVSGRRLTGE